MTRNSLPHRRRSVTQKATITGHTVHFTAGFYDDGKVGEVFIDLSKQGTALRGWASATALLISMLLQYGAPLSEIVDALKGTKTEMEPEVDVLHHPTITRASGMLDLIARTLEELDGSLPAIGEETGNVDGVQ